VNERTTNTKLILQIEEKSGTSTTEFLARLFQTGETVNYRAISPKGKTLGTIITTDSSRLTQLNQDRGIYFVVNSGGDKDNEITKFNAFFMEIDSLFLSTQRRKIEASPIPPSIRVKTKKSLHSYWPICGPCSKAEWKDMQERLIHYFNSDPSISNPSRVMRLPGYDHIDEQENRRKVLVEHFSEKNFTLAEMQAAYPAVPAVTATTAISEKYRHDGNEDLREVIRSKGTSRPNGNIDMKCPAHNGTSLTSLVLYKDGGVGCHSRCKYDVIRQALGLAPRQAGVSQAVVTAPAGPFVPTYISISRANIAKLPVPGEVAFNADRGDLVAVLSVTNVGKSTLFRNAAICLAVGRPFGDLNPDLSQLKKVMLWTFEQGEPAHHMVTMMDALTPQEEILLDKNCVREYMPSKLSTAEGMDYFKRSIEHFKPDVVFIDTYSTALGLINENDNSEATRLLSALEAVARQYKFVCVLAHHLGKSKSEDGTIKEEVYRGRGASAIEGVIPSVYTMLASPSSDLLVDLRSVKNKLGKGKYNQPMSLNAETCWFDIQAPAKKIQRADKTLDYILKNNGVTTKQIAEHIQKSEDTALADLKRLEATKKIKRVTGAHNTFTWQEVSEI